MNDITQSKLFYGKELTFDEAEHFYKWGGSPVPGVTSILRVMDKPALMPWAIGVTRDFWLEQINAGRTDYAKIHKESWSATKKITKAAADIGKNVHAYAEAHFKEKPLPTLETDQAKRGVEAFHKWLDAHKIKVLASERMVFSEQFYYAGTTDLIAEVDGVLTVGDIKTSSGIYVDMRFQTAAYQHAIQEEKGIKFPQRLIIRFDKKTGEFEAKLFKDFDTDFAGFEAALRLYKTMQQIERAG